MSTIKCIQCKRDKEIADYDLDRHGRPRKSCRTCLSRAREHTRRRAEARRQRIANNEESFLPSIAPVVPLAFQSARARWRPLELGRMKVICSSCQSLHWICERVHGSSIALPRFESCCKKGDIQLPALGQAPEYLQYLLESTDSVPKQFRARIREYNSALTFTSVKYNSDERVGAQVAGVRCFQIHGELYHLQGPLTAAAQDTPKFAQLYFYDPVYAAYLRQQEHPNLDLAILERLTNELNIVNPFISLYKTAKERLDAASQGDGNVRMLLNLQLRLVMEHGADKRRENLPTSNEVAAIIPDEYGDSGFRDIVLAHKNPDVNRQFSVIDPNHAAYMPLHYVLLFPNGENGWHWGLRLRDELNRRKNLRLQQREFYRYVSIPFVLNNLLTYLTF
ncbi:uncharacterized protein LAJ45_11579 [Morchella importuna]|uniref:uncharacterized protein n=1 Tax=Morchella importuna TaxID=1174673 RepID=UPI001E8E53EE|nr:uncharacterized protein LAJ45_11579 [Morchella importuna]KAH8144449.1 hypothetical protein LAJ45_11579 [Morchella importuna]